MWIKQLLLASIQTITIFWIEDITPTRRIVQSFAITSTAISKCVESNFHCDVAV